MKFQLRSDDDSETLARSYQLTQRQLNSSAYTVNLTRAAVIIVGAALMFWEKSYQPSAAVYEAEGAVLAYFYFRACATLANRFKNRLHRDGSVVTRAVEVVEAMRPARVKNKDPEGPSM